MLAIAPAFAAKSRPIPSRKPSSTPPEWAADPHSPGPDLPAKGRSLFDALIATTPDKKVPFPFEKLADLVDQQVVDGAGAKHKAVLIPLGRSLQRSAAAPDFFKFPRIVLATAAPPKQSDAELGLLLRDRLYIGYQEKAAALEVISYNEALGRFEFQVVRDYQPGAVPKIYYATRPLCMSCHQGQSPIFSRPFWDETNGSADIAAKLAQTLGPDVSAFHGVPVTQGISVPYEIDTATDRANLYSAYQKIWQEGCGGSADSPRCRSSLLALALQYRLSSDDQFDASSDLYAAAFGAGVVAQRAQRWPAGLAITNPNLPNRNPSETAPGAHLQDFSGLLDPGAQASAVLDDLLKNSNIPKDYEPLNARPPLEVWDLASGDPTFIHGVVLGVSEFLSAGDIALLDKRLYEAGRQSSARSTYAADCTLQVNANNAAFRRYYLTCDGASFPLNLQGSFKVKDGSVVDGSFSRIAFRDPQETCVWTPSAAGDKPCGDVHNVGVRGTVSGTNDAPLVADLVATQAVSGLHARRLNGDALSSFKVTFTPGDTTRAHVEIVLLNDFSLLTAALGRLATKGNGEDLALGAGPIRRSLLLGAIYSELGLATPRSSADASGLPAPEVDPLPAPLLHPVTGLDSAFLSTLQSSCAMCHASPQPTPPNFLLEEGRDVAATLRGCAERLYYRLSMWDLPANQRKKTPMPPLATTGMDEAHWKNSPELKQMKDSLQKILQEKNVNEAQLLATPFENLPPCKGVSL
ncbi:MAG: hypothetical protein JST16_14120 [Bdellovibrionales bacterium]|nr:hypothetical protein [Bdellovibrionales bacterium]